jgi:hypothetical protein
MEKHKGEKRMELRKISIALLAVFLAAMVMVPLANAGTGNSISVASDGGAVSDPHHEIPSDYPQDSRVAQWLPESAMINIVISQRTLEKFDQEKQSGIITLPVSSLDLKTAFVSTPEKPSFFIESSLKPAEGIVLLRLPKDMYNRFISESYDGKLSLPVDYFFRYYENTSDLDSHIVAHGNTLQILPSNNYPLKPVSASSISEQQGLAPASAVSAMKTSTVLSYPQMFEARRYFNRISSTNYNYCIGQITPYSWSLTGSALDQFDVFQEREYRFNSNEAIEIVTKYRDRNQGGDIIITPALYRSGASSPIAPGQWTSWGGEIPVDKNNLPHAYGYHVQFSGGYYYINFEDMNTMNWINSYVATAASGTSSFIELWGSSEYRQRSAPTTNTFSATTNPVKDEWARILNGNWMKPNQVWNYVSSQTAGYVTVTKSFDGSGNLITVSNGHYP